MEALILSIDMWHFTLFIYERRRRYPFTHSWVSICDRFDEVSPFNSIFKLLYNICMLTPL